MNVKRAIGIGLVAYLCSFILSIVVVLLYGLDLTQTGNAPKLILIINILISIVLVTLFSLFYFKDKKLNADIKEGLHFGFVLIIIGFILDFIGFSISFAVGSKQDIILYYSNPYFWIALTLLIATTAVVGYIKGKKK